VIEEVGHEGSRAFGPGLNGKHRGSFQKQTLCGCVGGVVVEGMKVADGSHWFRGLAIKIHLRRKHCPH